MTMHARLFFALLWLPLLAAQEAAGAAPQATHQDPAGKEAIAAFQSGWSKWETSRKIDEVRKLAAVGGAEVATTLAGKLNDKVAVVRIEVAGALGQLKEPKTLNALAGALEREGDDIDVFRAVCRALGQLDDPKAVAPLSRGILSGDHRSSAWRDQANARLEAIGSIRHKESVDELIGLLTKAGGTGRRGGGGAGGFAEFQRSIQNQLRRLTGQNLRGDLEWRSWWKENREKFRFR